MKTILRDDAAQSMKDARNKAKDLGKFYTPECICRLLARLAKIPDVRRVYDPTCGSGGLLLYGREEYGQDVELIGEEINPESVVLCRKNFINAGVSRNELFCRDVLTNPAEIAPVDVVLGNPPFGVPWTPTPDPAFPVLAPKGRADLAFIQRGFARLREGGKMAVVVSPGVLTSSGAELEIRKTWIGSLETVVALPGKLFEGTSIAVCALVFARGTDCADVLFVDAGSFSTKETHSRSRISDEQLDEIVRIVSERKDSEFSKLVPNAELDPARFDPESYLRKKGDGADIIPSIDELLTAFRKKWEEEFAAGIRIYWETARAIGREAVLPEEFAAEFNGKTVRWRRINEE